MVTNSNDKNLSSKNDKGFDHDHRFRTVLSRSKRVKLGIVLGLMLCGYVLIDDGASEGPETFVPELPEIPESFDTLSFVDTEETRQLLTEQIQSFPRRTTDTGPASANAVPQPPAEPTKDGIAGKFDQPPVAQPHHYSVKQLSDTSPEISAVRPTLRFTGRIEPLH